MKIWSRGASVRTLRAGMLGEPEPFIVLSGLTILAAIGTAAALIALVGWQVRSPVQFWVLSAFVVAGEFLPIPIPGRQGIDKVTVSSAFAFALLLSAGPVAACATYAVASAIADLRDRTVPLRLLFNAAQYTLSLAGAGAVIIACGFDAPVPANAGALPAILLAATASLMINHVVAGTGAALLSAHPVVPYLRHDLVFQAWTAGSILALGPAVAVSADASALFIPLTFVPMLAIFLGARQAEISAHRATHDLLTGLPNRIVLHDAIHSVAGGERASAHGERASAHVAVMILDVDDFDAINATFGHEIGDRVLKQMALRLTDALTESPIVARVGGDEFAAVLVDVADEADAGRRAQRWLDAVDPPFAVDALLLEVSGSIGVAYGGPDADIVDDLLRRADVALYRAKTDRSVSAIYSPALDQRSVERLALAPQLRRGLTQREFVVHYQPKLPLTDRGLAGVEALVRWNHPTRGAIAPDLFIPVAEQTGLIKSLTEYVFEAALRQCEQWRADRFDLTFAVNVSTRSLLDRDLLPMIRRLLDRFALPAEVLQLEITESRLITDFVQARSVLDELRTIGLKLAIDDFGTGFSSLTQLQQLPVDEVKIDRSFVRDMETNPDDAVLVRSIIDLAHNLGLSVTAEGVETEGVKAFLRRLGCDYAQGFHIARPLPADACRRRLQTAGA